MQRVFGPCYRCVISFVSASQYKQLLITRQKYRGTLKMQTGNREPETAARLQTVLHCAMNTITAQTVNYFTVSSVTEQPYVCGSNDDGCCRHVRCVSVGITISHRSRAIMPSSCDKPCRRRPLGLRHCVSVSRSLRKQ